MSIALPPGSTLKLPPQAVRPYTDSTLPARARLQEAPPAGSIIADNHPSNIYATLQKHGQTIATLYKSGGMMTPNAIGLPADLSQSGIGLPLAEQRLQQMLQLYGGTVHYAQQAGSPPPPERASALFVAQLARHGF